MAKPLIFYRTMLRESTTTITDPGSASGYPIANIKDLRSFTTWKSNALTAPIHIDIDTGAGGANADYIGLVNHNLYTLGATIRVLGDGASPPVTERLAATTVSQDTVSYKLFTPPGAVRYWRVTLNHPAAGFTSAPLIGELFLGMRTTATEYLTPDFDPFLKDVEVAGSRSEGGHYLGGTMRGQRHRGRISFGPTGVTRAFLTSDLNAFLDNHAYLRRPFIFVVDSDDSDFATGRYLKLPDDSHPDRMAVGGGWSSRMTFDMDIEEAFMEPA